VEVPTIVLPDAIQIETVEIPLPTADVPYYIPMVVPPSDLRDQEAKPVKTEEKVEPPTLKIPFIKQPVPQPSTEVIVVAATTAITAVAATTLTQPIIEWIRKKIQKFLQDKITTWRKNLTNKKDSSNESKKE
tara:strand:+ start:5372 stop:5767 length:396 start_codon:yes stop_codon:yes gene_type:complete